MMTSPLLSIQNLSAFYGKAQVLFDLSLSLNEAEALAIIGPNGAGKSTMMQSIMQFLPTQTGQVCFNGQTITGWPVHRVAQAGIGYVPQERRIFPRLTVEENIRCGLKPGSGSDKHKTPHKTPWSLERLYDLFPNLADRRLHLGGTLSGGEQQMLAMARTLAGNPRLLLLDEPAEGIAPIIAENLARAIVEARAEGLAVLLCEQSQVFIDQINCESRELHGGILNTVLK